MTASARRVLAGLAVAAVPTVVLVVAAWYRFAVYADREARLYAHWSVVLVVLAVLAGEALVVLRLAGGGRWWRRGSTVVAYGWAAGTLAWYVVLSVLLDWRLAPGLLACLPTTLLSLFLFRRVERNRRVPWRLVVLPVLWGASVATVCARLLTPFPEAAVMRAVTPGAATPYADALVVAASEEAIKAIGVLVVLVVSRHRLHGLLGGLLVGAFVGAGFQLLEASLYMAGSGAETMLYQYWVRQYTSLLTSHTVFSGLAGAGIGLAWQQRGLVWKVVCGLGGYLAAVAAHACWNVAASTDLLWLPKNAALHLFLALPVNILVFNGPFVLLYSVSVVCALRFELRGLVAAMLAEARTGTGAITPDEVGVLASASTRWRRRIARLRRGDLPGYLHLRALHAAQVDLAYARWHRARGECGVDSFTVRMARERALRARDAEPMAQERDVTRANVVTMESPA